MNMNTRKRLYALEDVLLFGKYRNRTLKSVLDTDQQYIFWCLSKLPTFEMSNDAWTYATTINPSFVAIKPTTCHEAVPYSEGVEMLLCNPWNGQQWANRKEGAEDVQIILPFTQHYHTAPMQLSLL